MWSLKGAALNLFILNIKNDFLLAIGTVVCKKKGNENFPNVNLILSICQFELMNHFC
jgi:hypothetical protein